MYKCKYIDIVFTNIIISSHKYTYEWPEQKGNILHVHRSFSFYNTVTQYFCIILTFCAIFPNMLYGGMIAMLQTCSVEVWLLCSKHALWRYDCYVPNMLHGGMTAMFQTCSMEVWLLCSRHALWRYDCYVPNMLYGGMTAMFQTCSVEVWLLCSKHALWGYDCYVPNMFYGGMTAMFQTCFMHGMTAMLQLQSLLYFKSAFNYSLVEKYLRSGWYFKVCSYSWKKLNGHVVAW